jgi:hypothetical protein
MKEREVIPFQEDIYINDETPIDNIKSFSLDNRILYYYYIIKLLAKINIDRCLEKIKSKNFKIRSYTIDDVLILENRIGSKSAYGVIYLSSIANSKCDQCIASKVMEYEDENINEIEVMKYITDEVILKKKSKHFAMMYKYTICNNEKVNSKNRIVCINELAHGDIKMLVTSGDLFNDYEELMNILFQTFISIGTFQNLVGYIHGDTHYGNFLYQKNDEVGYYYYLFDGEHYYLKSCNYNIMIYDFGFAEKKDKYNMNSHKIARDYTIIARLFMDERKKYNSKNKLININIYNILLKISKFTEKLNSKDFFYYLIKYIFIPYSINGLFTKSPPHHSKIINKTPFIIN